MAHKERQGSMGAKKIAHKQGKGEWFLQVDERCDTHNIKNRPNTVPRWQAESNGQRNGPRI